MTLKFGFCKCTAVNTQRKKSKQYLSGAHGPSCKYLGNHSKPHQSKKNEKFHPFPHLKPNVPNIRSSSG